MSIRKNVANTAERGVVSLLNAASLSSPEYQPIELPDKHEPTFHEESDVSVFGKLLMKSGAAVTALGIATEVLSDSADNIADLTAASGIGAAAIGACIVAYDKILS